MGISLPSFLCSWGVSDVDVLSMEVFNASGHWWLDGLPISGLALINKTCNLSYKVSYIDWLLLM